MHARAYWINSIFNQTLCLLGALKISDRTDSIVVQQGVWYVGEINLWTGMISWTRPKSSNKSCNQTRVFISVSSVMKFIWCWVLKWQDYWPKISICAQWKSLYFVNTTKCAPKLLVLIEETNQKDSNDLSHIFFKSHILSFFD